MLEAVLSERGGESLGALGDPLDALSGVRVDIEDDVDFVGAVRGDGVGPLDGLLGEGTQTRQVEGELAEWREPLLPREVTRSRPRDGVLKGRDGRLRLPEQGAHRLLQPE